MLDDVDDALLHAFLQGFRLMRDPLELAVQLALGGKNGDLAQAWAQAGFVAEIPVDGAEMRRGPGAVELDARRPLQPRDCRAGRGSAIGGSLARLIQIIAVGKRK